MEIIYKSFFKKKTTKIYWWVFIILGIIFSILIISKEYLIKEANKVYENSFLSFKTSDKLNLDKKKNIKNYNRTIKVDCNNDMINVFVTDSVPIINNNETSNKCLVDGYTLEYSLLNTINITNNPKLYNLLDKEEKEYYYFISLKDWLKNNETSKYLSNKYNIEIDVIEHKIDSNDYHYIIVIFNIFIGIVSLLFIILSIISMFNILVDEKNNNRLYYYLGYSTSLISYITLLKIILLLLIPFMIVIISFISLSFIK